MTKTTMTIITEKNIDERIKLARKKGDWELVDVLVKTKRFFSETR